MAGMGTHSDAGRPLRRAHFAAWFTFTFMAGTTMAFQTYHSVETGQMPWPLAVLYGIGAFILAISVLEFARHAPPAVRAGAYALTAGAMYLSASATGDVTRHAAPPHAELLFGLLMDGAALLAIHFILNGPRAADAVSAAAAREAVLRAEANAERSARQAAEANAARAERELRAEWNAERETERQANEAASVRLARELEEARAAGRREANARQRADAELAAARAELAASEAGRQAAEAGLRATGTAQDEAATRTERQVGALQSQLDAARAAAAMRPAVEAERDAALRKLAVIETELDEALTARGEAERSAANAEAKAERLARKAAAQDGPKAGRSARTEAARGDRPEGALTPAQAREKAYDMLDKDPDLTGAELGEPFGFGDRWGQKRKEEYEHRNGLRAVGEN